MSKRLTMLQVRIRDAVSYLKTYWRTYDKQPGYIDYSERILIDDALYGLGAAFGKKYEGAAGYDAFKGRLREHLNSPMPKMPLDALRIAVPLLRKRGYALEANAVEILIADILERETPAPTESLAKMLGKLPAELRLHHMLGDDNA